MTDRNCAKDTGDNGEDILSILPAETPIRQTKERRYRFTSPDEVLLTVAQSHRHLFPRMSNLLMDGRVATAIGDIASDASTVDRLLHDHYRQLLDANRDGISTGKEAAGD